jgi:hypothetical protein
MAAVRRQAAADGLRFEAYLPPRLAAWVISLVEQEVFHSPAEAVFVAMQSFRELEDHPEVKQALLTKIMQKSIDSVERAEGCLPRRSWHVSRKSWKGHERSRPYGTSRLTGHYFPKTDYPPSPCPWG